MPGYFSRKLIRKLPGKLINMIPKPNPVIIEGFNTRSKVGEICRDNNFMRALLVTDRILFELGHHEPVCNSLQKAGVRFEVFSDISSEPNIKMIEEGRKAAVGIDAQCIIALGGGSVMDASKMIASGCKLKHFTTRELLVKFLFVPGGSIPMINIPSTAGTGAEMTIGAIISRQKSKGSTVIVGLDISHVILDSSLSVGAPIQLQAACGIDALSHGLEGVVADISSSEDDLYKSMECVRLVMENMPHILNGTADTQHRQAMFRAANYGGNAINKQLAGYIHAFAHSIGARYHIPHGKAIAICLIPVIETQKEFCMDKLVRLSKHCGYTYGNIHTTDEELVERFIRGLSDIIGQCGFDKMEGIIPEEDIKTLTRMISLDSINYCAPVTFTDKQIVETLIKIRNRYGK